MHPYSLALYIVKVEKVLREKGSQRERKTAAVCAVSFVVLASCRQPQSNLNTSRIREDTRVETGL